MRTETSHRPDRTISQRNKDAGISVEVSDVPKILGKFTYLKEANLPDEKIDDVFEMENGNFSVQGISLWDSKPQYGFYMELAAVK